MSENENDKPVLKVHGKFRSPSVGVAFRSAGVVGDGHLEMTEAGLRVVGTWRKPGSKFAWGLLGFLVGGIVGAILAGVVRVDALAPIFPLVFTIAGLVGGIFIGRAGKPQPLDVVHPWVKLEDTHFDGATYSFRTWLKPRGTYHLDVAIEDKKAAGDLVKLTLKRRFA
jgi:hypothetical protein